MKKGYLFTYAALVTALNFSPLEKLVSSSCGQEQTSAQSQVINTAALRYWADTIIGNQDRKLSQDEVDSLQTKFNESPSKELYIITKSDLDDFKPFPTTYTIQKIFVSEQEVRKTFKGKSMNNGIGIFKINREGTIIKAWASFGYISEQDWEEKAIPNIDYAKEMK